MLPQHTHSSDKLQNTNHQQQLDIDNYNDTLNDQNAGADHPQSYVDQPQFIIKKGKVLDSQTEFVSFKRANITKWGSIQQVINQLERYIG